MPKFLRSLFALLIIIVASAALLSFLEHWSEQRALLREQEKTQRVATVFLVVYDGEENEALPSDAPIDTFERVGCQDLLVPYEIPVFSTRLKSVLTALSEYRPPLGLHNPFKEAGLIVDDVETRGHAAALIHLSGQLELGGVCDTPRLKAQIEKTIALYEDPFEILLNDSAEAYKCIGDLRGECE